MGNDQKEVKKKQERNTIWLIPLAAGIVAIFLVYLAYSHSPTHEYYNPENPYSADHTYEDSKSISKIPPDPNPYKQTGKKHSEEKKESYVAQRSDLAAQWAMAHYTFIGLVIGLIGIAFLVWTIIETRKAAHLAQEALTETRISSRKELRAYITSAATIDNSYGRTTICVLITVKNDGQTPAVNYFANYRFLADEQEIFAPDMGLKALTIPPSGKITYRFDIIKADFSGAEQIVVEINAKFNDIFGFDRFIKEVKAIETDRLPIAPRKIKRVLTGPDDESNLMDNPRFVETVNMFTVEFDDDLQEEAKQYAETNKAS